MKIVNTIRKLNVWGVSRIFIWLIFFVLPLLALSTKKSTQIESTNYSFLSIFISFFIPLFWSLLICVFEKYSGLKGKNDNIWKRPNINAIPFKSAPLQFWWTGYILFICLGSGVLIATLINNNFCNFDTQSIYVIATGSGGLAGIKLALSIFRSSFEV